MAEGVRSATDLIQQRARLKNEAITIVAAEEESLCAMEECGQKLATRVLSRYEHSRQSSMERLKAEARLTPIVANYLRGSGLQSFIQDLEQGIEGQVARSGYDSVEEVERDALEADLSLDLLEAKREVGNPFRSCPEMDFRLVILWFRCCARSATSNEAFVRYQAITQTTVNKSEFIGRLLERAEYDLQPDSLRGIAGSAARMPRGALQVATELGNANKLARLEQEGEKIATQEEQKAHLVNLLRYHFGESQFEKLFLHQIARMIRTLGVKALLDDPGLMRNLLEVCHPPLKQVALVRALAEQGAFDELAALKQHQGWNTALGRYPHAFYDAVLLALARQQPNQFTASSVPSSTAYRSSDAARMKTPHTVDYWFEQWMIESGLSLQGEGLELAQKKRTLFLQWSVVYARMALCVPQSIAKECVEKMEQYYESHWQQRRELIGLGQDPIPSGIAHVTTLDVARAYATPEALILSKFDLMKIDEENEKQVLEIGFLLLRHVAKRRSAIQRESA